MKILISSLLLFSAHSAHSAETSVISRLKPADGYRVEVYASGVQGARSLTRSPKGTIFVGTRGGNVYALRDGKLFTLAKSLDSPNGVAFREGTLYVAEVSRILKFEKVDTRIDALAKDPKAEKKGLDYKVIYKKLPTEQHHGWKFIAFGPDGALYVPVGAPCNICERTDDPRFASILRFASLDGTDPELYASGIRNTVGFAWHPTTKALWFTDNGRDNLGEDVPADELNVATKKGMHFGYPYCHQGDISDPEFGSKHRCSEFTPPAHLFGAHVAALGMRFLDEDTALVAEHGSWNRKEPVGYRVVRVIFKNGKPIKEEPFLDGFRTSTGDVIGRPVDVEVLPDHSVLISDDKGDTIYRMVETNIRR